MTRPCARVRRDETQHTAVAEAEMGSLDVRIALAQDTVVGDDHPLAVVRLGPPMAVAAFRCRGVPVAGDVAVLRLLAVAAGGIGPRLLPLGIVIGVIKVTAVVLRPRLRRRGKAEHEYRQDSGGADTSNRPDIAGLVRCADRQGS